MTYSACYTYQSELLAGVSEETTQRRDRGHREKNSLSVNSANPEHSVLKIFGLTVT